MPAQFLDTLLPIVVGVEPWEGLGEGGVVETAGQPGGVMDEAQGAQGLDEMEFAGVEFVKVFITGQEVGQLGRPFFAPAGQQHPEILQDL